MTTPRIEKLSAQLANQIAAGEVIERPASVIKELLENSLDAGADQIQIYVTAEGIRVTDNGGGIHREDLPLAVAPQATSKVKKADDLGHITSLGFRGEALASIAAISHFQIMTRRITDETGWQLRVVGGEIQTVEPVAHPVGTTVIVNDLFFNTPVRKRFLRSERTEFNYIEAVVTQMALSHFEVQFTLIHEKKEIFRLPKAVQQTEKEKRIQKICGKDFLAHALWLDIEATGLRLHGWVANENFLRSQADKQFFYVNQRFVRDRLLMHAMRQSYEQVLPPGRQPAYVLFLTIAPEAIDVNVHPTKHELRFHQGRLIHDFIYQKLSQLLYGEQPSLFSDAMLTPSITTSKVTTTTGKCIGQWHRYILAEVNQELFFIHRKRAEQALRYIQWITAFTHQTIEVLTLPQPEMISVEKTVLPLVEKYQTFLNTLGFGVAPFQQETVIVREIPRYFATVDLQRWLSAVFMHIKRLTTESQAGAFLKQISFMAESLSVDLTAAAEQALIEQVIALRQNPWVAFHYFCHILRADSFETTFLQTV